MARCDPDNSQTIWSDIYTDEQVAALSFEDKSNWIRCNPVTAAAPITMEHDYSSLLCIKASEECSVFISSSPGIC